MTFYPPPGDPLAQPPDPGQGYPPPGYQPVYPPPVGYGQMPVYGPPPGYVPGYPPYGSMPPPPPMPPGMHGYAPVPGGRLAGMGARFGGLVLDSLILLVPNGIIGVLVGGYTTTTTHPNCDHFGTCTTSHGVSIGWAPILLGTLVGLVYYGYFAGVRTQTPGHMAAGIRVVDVNTGQPIGFWRGVLRWFVLDITAAICTLGYWSPFFDSMRRQGWHDKAASAVVIPAVGH